jgi:hypothetical protein
MGKCLYLKAKGGSGNLGFMRKGLTIAKLSIVQDT